MYDSVTARSSRSSSVRPTKPTAEPKTVSQAIAAIAWLTIFGSAVGFVGLTLLLRELRAVTLSYIPLVLPFGALGFGWALYDEPITRLALAGAGLVAAGLLVAQWPGRGRAASAVARVDPGGLEAQPAPSARNG